MPVMDLDSIGGMPPGSLLPDLPSETHPVLKEVVLRLREAGD